MGRRKHKKSRNGCVNCKRRHVKCDETRPKCVNCITSNLKCVYVTNQPRPDLEVETDNLTPISANSIESSNPEGGRQNLLNNTVQIRQVPDNSSALLNLPYLELLHHYSTVTYKTLAVDPVHRDIFQSTAVKMGISNPFLMYEILAISALHMAHCYPENMHFYQTKSTELQTISLNTFRMTQQNINAESAGAVFLFSSLLGLHVLADPSRTRDLPFNQYLDNVLESLNLMHSARELVMTKHYPDVFSSDLNPLREVQEPAKPYDVPDECHRLEQMIEESDLGENSKLAYHGAIEKLFWIYALSEVPHRSHSTIRFLMAWPLQIKEDYLKLLNQRRPEALILLAYYGVILHYYRDCWVAGDIGMRLISAIDTYVGRSWEEWMAWPKQMIRSTDLPPST